MRPSLNSSSPDDKQSLPEERVEHLTLRDHFALVALKELIAIYPSETAEKKALDGY